MFTSVRILLRAAQQWSANADSRLGAALAYYALFSIAPLLVTYDPVSISTKIASAVAAESSANPSVTGPAPGAPAP